MKLLGDVVSKHRPSLLSFLDTIGDIPLTFERREELRGILASELVVRPPALYLSDQIAEQGEVIVPILKSKLRTKKTESTVRDIVQVVWWLGKSRRCACLKDQELIDLLEQQVRDMHGIWREITLKEYQEILSLR